MRKPSGHERELPGEHRRAQALKEGRLIDLSPLARKAGIPVPTAMTTELWAEYGAPGTDPEIQPGPLWDIVCELQRCLSGRTPCRVAFDSGRLVRWVAVCTFHPLKREVTVAEIKALSGPGDQGELVLTIVLPDQEWPARPILAD